LCAGLQEILNLPEPPHFLVPGYTATIDRWLDPQTQQLQTYAEAYPLVLQYQALLNAVFQTDVTWQVAPVTEGLCDPILLATYRNSFPQLWEEHELVVRFERSLTTSNLIEPVSPQPSIKHNRQLLGYTLHLFIAGHNPATQRILQSLRQVLEQFNYPYTLKVIDVLKYPDQAEIYQVTATPTLIKVSPQPIRRLVGNLDNAEKLLQLLTFPET
jgi:circadian clock protein KaiB